MNRAVLRGHMLRQDLYVDDPDRDTSDHAPGPVTTYYLTPAEIESRYGGIKPMQSKAQTEAAKQFNEKRKSIFGLFDGGKENHEVADITGTHITVIGRLRNEWRTSRGSEAVKTAEASRMMSDETKERETDAAQGHRRCERCDDERCDEGCANDESRSEESEEQADLERELREIAEDHAARRYDGDDDDETQVESRDGERERELREIVLAHADDDVPTPPQTFGAMTVAGAVRGCDVEGLLRTRSPLITKRDALAITRLCAALLADVETLPAAHRNAREKRTVELCDVVAPIAERVLLGDEA